MMCSQLRVHGTSCMNTYLYTQLRSFRQQQYRQGKPNKMSAHRMADKYPACIQYTAQYVHHDMSQLHKELYTRVEEDITSVLKIIFNFVKPPQISCFNFSGIKIGNFLCRFFFSPRFPSHVHGIYKEPIGFRMGFLCNFCTR